MTLTIINVISALPILLYPALLITGIMSFDAPSSGRAISAWVLFIFSIAYPLVILALIFLSRRYDSLSLALIALIPLIVLVYVFFVSGGTAQKNSFNTLKKDYVCDSSSFLSLGGNETDPIRKLQLLEKWNFLTYKNNVIASIYGNKWINAERINLKDIRDRTDQLLSSCKNNEGKTPIQVYSRVEDGQVKEIMKQI